MRFSTKNNGAVKYICRRLDENVMGSYNGYSGIYILVREEHAIETDIPRSFPSFYSPGVHLFRCEPGFPSCIEINFVRSLRKGSLPSVANGIEDSHDRKSEVSHCTKHGQSSVVFRTVAEWDSRKKFSATSAAVSAIPPTGQIAT